jgi:hypothetical protein
MTGPIGSAYPGTPLVLAFLCLLAAAFFRSTLAARRRRTGVIGRWDSAADTIAVVMALLFVLVVAGVIWSHR